MFKTAQKANKGHVGVFEGISSISDLLYSESEPVQPTQVYRRYLDQIGNNKI